MIQMFHVSKTYPKDVVALSDITLHIQKGEFVFLCGPSGAGKTTLLRLIFRDELPTDGQILVNGRNVVRLRESKLPALRRSIGVIFQDFKLLMDRTVYDNLHLVTRVLGIPETISRRKIGRLLKEVGLLQKADQIPYSLSGGEQQRVAIARALVSDPAILLADEPTGNLDPDLALDVMRLLAEVNIRGTTVVVATHNPKLVAEMGHHTLILKQGRLVEEIP
ncbi:MAG: cell division ATP-binding protein FtsE [Candidatus Methylomirabilales bacterium]|nr:cell division ATP-binding protein FtsE [candidate division NC10 bacterium]MCH7895987.1 cell division ATP-binding protein FtsE [candidate division NC10 bacterium]MCZ6549881.1 cell division ATP-binding protein FtsE [candidate division NC10 bacterium]